MSPDAALAASPARRLADSVGVSGVRGVLFVLYVLALMLAPLWYGSAPLLAQYGNAVAFGTLSCLLAMTSAGAAIVPGDPAVRIWPAAVLWIGVVVWVLLQAASFTPESWHHPIWAMASDLLGRPVAGAISLNPAASLQEAMRLATCGLVFWLALQFGRDARMAVFILWAILGAAFVYSCYGILDVLAGWNRVLLAPKDAFVTSNYGALVTGTFINRNHYAAYAATALIIATAMFLREVNHVRRDSRRPLGIQIAEAAADALRRCTPIVIAALPLIVGLQMSQSRGGLVSAAVGLLVVVVLYAIRSRQKLVFGGIGVAAILVLAVLSVVFGDTIIRRTLSQSDPLSGRMEVYRLVVEATGDRPWLGFGAGSFIDFFPLYRDATAGFGSTWNAAHNSWIEVLATLGIPATCALVLALAILVGRCLVGALRRKQNALAPIAATGVSVTLAVHSAVDFPLQVEAIAIGFAAILGLGVAQSWSSRGSGITGHV